MLGILEKYTVQVIKTLTFTFCLDFFTFWFLGAMKLAIVGFLITFSSCVVVFLFVFLNVKLTLSKFKLTNSVKLVL